MAIILSQIQAKLTELVHQKNALIYEKLLYEQKIERVKAGIEVINGATSVYQDWAKNISEEAQDENKKEEKSDE